MNLQFLKIVYIFYDHNIVFDQQPNTYSYICNSFTVVYLIFFVSKLKVCFIHENEKITKLEDNYEISTESLNSFLKEDFYRSISRF